MPAAMLATKACHQCLQHNGFAADACRQLLLADACDLRLPPSWLPTPLFPVAGAPLNQCSPQPMLDCCPLPMLLTSHSLCPTIILLRRMLLLPTLPFRLQTLVQCPHSLHPACCPHLPHCYLRIAARAHAACFQCCLHLNRLVAPSKCRLLTRPHTSTIPTTHAGTSRPRQLLLMPYAVYATRLRRVLPMVTALPLAVNVRCPGWLSLHAARPLPCQVTG